MKIYASCRPYDIDIGGLSHYVIYQCLFSCKCWYKNKQATFINSLWPCDTIWWRRSQSTLAKVMACCLMAPSHDLNQCWSLMLGAHLNTFVVEAILLLIMEIYLHIFKGTCDSNLILVRFSVEFIFCGPVDGELSLVQQMAWIKIGNIPLMALVRYIFVQFCSCPKLMPVKLPGMNMGKWILSIQKSKFKFKTLPLQKELMH